MKYVFIVTADLVLSGCCSYMPADLMFPVKGIAPSDTECELHLLFEGKEAAPREPVTGEFYTLFYVSFCKRQYRLQALCEGRTVYEKAVLFPGDFDIKNPYDMGQLGRKGD